jgi:hypothetical protein
MPMARKAKRGICISIRLTLDPDIDAPLLQALAVTPRGRRAALMRQWLRAAYLTMAASGSQLGEQEDVLAWVDDVLEEE